MPELIAQGISAGYDGPPVLDEVSVKAESGQISVILGPNGAGKSTLAKAIVGLLPILTGSVHLDDADVTGLRPHVLVRRGIAYLPQLMNIFDQMSVVDNLEMGAYIRTSGIRERIEFVLGLFPDIATDRKKRAGALSGGQQRMLALARMLMTEPKAAILDEPTAGLSPMYAERVWEHIRGIAEQGVGLLVVEQNATMAIEHADSVFILAQGRNVLSGSANDVRHHHEVTKILVG